MDDKPSHEITIEVRGNYAHGQATHARVMMAGEGDAHHFVDAMRAAMVAAGFSAQVAAKLELVGVTD